MKKPPNLKNITISNGEKIELIMNLSTMIAAGISILSTVESLLEDAKGNQKIVLQTLNDHIYQGKHVYTAFAEFPQIFDKVTVNIVKAAEESGNLDVVLKDVKDNIRKEMEFNDKLKSALMYPVLIMFVFVGVLLMILVVVIPKISVVFLRLKVALPLPTRVLMFASDIVMNHTAPFIAISALIIGVITYLFKTQRKLILQPFLSLPIISPLMLKIDLTRFSYSLYLLLNSGIPITTALQLAEEVVVKKEIFTIVKRTYEMVVSGKNISEGLKKGKKYIPSIMIKLVEAGEKSGTLDKSLHDVSEYLDYEVASAVKTATALLEPVMLVVVGVLVGGMMMAIIAPIYGLIGSVSAK
jgi:type II secretory pathway component PulF